MVLKEKATWASSPYPPKEKLMKQEQWLKPTVDGLGFDFVSCCVCVHVCVTHVCIVYVCVTMCAYVHQR